jgi:hypothetical protein
MQFSKNLFKIYKTERKKKMIKRLLVAVAFFIFSLSFVLDARADGEINKEAKKVADEANDESVSKAEKRDGEAAKAWNDSEKAEEDLEDASAKKKAKAMEENDRDLDEADTSSSADQAKENRLQVYDSETAKAEDAAARKAKAAAKKEMAKALTSPSPAEAPKKERSTGMKIARSAALYIPNRLLDITDLITCQAGVGPEIVGQVKVTNYFKFFGFCGEKYFLTKGFGRQYGGGHSEGWEFDLGCFTKSYSYVDETFGTVDEYVFDHPDFHFASYKDNIYRQRICDFWGISARAGWLFNLGVGVHPVEIVDLVAGIFCIDLMDDDFEGSAAVRVEKAP